jgi:hypothetical protein
MNTRRDFFKVVTGQNINSQQSPNQEIKIALNRLHELPEPIIEMIEPVLFPEEEWKMVNNVIYPNSPSGEIGKNRYVLDEIDCVIFNFFREHEKLKKIAEKISCNNKLSYSESYQKVTSLFFKLANMRICHPREVYHLDELINDKI